jgi:hypothetical protein
LPERRDPPPDQARPVAREPAPAEWRWVARGASAKLAALLVGVVAAMIVLIDADWDLRRAFSSPSPVGVGVLIAAAALDVIGRLLCLATPQGSIRWMIVTSVACQLLAIPAVLGALFVEPATEDRWTFVGAAVLLQIVAAVTFTIYLFAVGVYFRSPPVIPFAAVKLMVK